ncbi:GNAT family N-acetyltransferase [Methylorubrum extorquens]
MLVGVPRPVHHGLVMSESAPSHSLGSCSAVDMPSSSRNKTGRRNPPHPSGWGGAQIGLRWSWYEFDELPPRTLYGILKLRQEIFIVEQDVVYPDIDGKDLRSAHLVCTFSDEVVAYSRLVPEGLFKQGALSFGRVTVRQDLRRVGLGRAVVSKVLERADESRGQLPIEISSQYYLMKFYASFGFVPHGDQYIEDHIPHIAMRRD